MSDYIEKLTLRELKDLTTIDVNVITQQVALDVCHKEKDKHESGLAMLCLWTQKLLKSYGFAKLSTNEWTQLVDLLKHALKRILAEVPNDKNNAVMELEGWLQECRDLWNTAHKELELNNFTVLLNLMVHTLMEFGLIHDLWIKNADLKTLVAEASNLHTLIVRLIESKVSVFNSKNCKPHRLDFIKINELLCMLLSRQTGVKTRAETWNCVGRMALLSADSFMQGEVMRQPITKLLDEIGSKINKIYCPEILKRPNCQVENYLRYTNFLLRLLKGLAYNFQYKKFLVADELFELYIATYKIPEFLIETEVANILRFHVLHETKEQLTLIFHHEYFNNLIFKNVNRLPDSLISDYLDVCARHATANFLDSQLNIWKFLFEKSFTNVSLFMHNLNYSKLLEWFGVIATISAPFSKYLRENILSSPNFLILHASYEIILCVAHSLEPEKCIEELRFWHKWNKTFVVFSVQLNASYVQLLLSFVFKLCQKNVPAAKLPIFDMPRKTTDYRNFMLWAQQNNNAVHLSQEVLEVLNKNNNEKTLEFYYKMTMKIYFLENPGEKLLQKITSILLTLLDNQKRFVVFEDALFRLLAKQVNKTKYATFECLLMKLQQRLPSHMNPSVAIMHFLYACAQCPEAKILSNTIISTIDDKRWRPMHCHSSESNQDLALDGINFMMKRHECSDESPKPKRPCFGSSENDRKVFSLELKPDNFIEILKNMHDRSKEVLKVHRTLMTEEVQLVCGIVENLQTVLQKKFN